MPFVLHDPRVAKWQARFARVPRWAWIAFAIGVIIPILVLAITIVAVALTTGVIVALAVLVVGSILSLAWRIMHRRKIGGRSDGRENVQIVVHSARVIDP